MIGHQGYFIFALSITLVFLVLAAQYESWAESGRSYPDRADARDSVRSGLLHREAGDR